MKPDPDHQHPPDSIELPTPTAWPIIAAFGLTLVFAGLVMNFFISAIGVFVGIIGAVGWFSDVFPHPQHEAVPVRPESERPLPVRTHGRVVRMLVSGDGAPNRAHIPTEIHPYRVGVLGGIAGGIVMAVMALIIGYVEYGSIWYPINLLAATGVPALSNESLEALRGFRLDGLIVGILAHGSISILVGLLYAILVPMLPRKWEWLFGGIITPLIWTAAFYVSISWINPTLQKGVDWTAFVLCQIAFGLVCGFVVFRSGKVATMQSWSVARRLGVESQYREDKNS